MNRSGSVPVKLSNICSQYSPEVWQNSSPTTRHTKHVRPEDEMRYFVRYFIIWRVNIIPVLFPLFSLTYYLLNHSPRDHGQKQHCLSELFFSFWIWVLFPCLKVSFEQSVYHRPVSIKSVFTLCWPWVSYIENNTWARVDMEFLFECLTR